MNKRTIILSSVFMLLVTLLGIKVYVVLAETQKTKSSPSIFRSTIDNRTIVIGENGETKIFEAKVVSIEGGTITAESIINNDPVTVTLLTDENTKFFKNGTSTSMSSTTMEVDSVFAIGGIFKSFTPNLTITAEEFRSIDIAQKNLAEKQKEVVKDIVSSDTTPNTDSEVVIPKDVEQIVVTETPAEATTTDIEIPEVVEQPVVDTTSTTTETSSVEDVSVPLEEVPVNDVSTSTDAVAE